MDRSRVRRRAVLAVAAVIVLASAAGRPAAASPVVPEPSYPFIGTWVRADRACTAAAPHVRTYTARDVSSSSGRCTFRKVVSESGHWELSEDCRRPERSGAMTETIRMLSPDVLLLKRQTSRLKIPRGRRFVRCTIAAPTVAAPAR